MNVLLAREVQRRVLAEPKAVNMNYFCEVLQDPSASNFCHTVGCIAGHVVMAAGISRKAIESFEIDNLEYVAGDLLQISRAEAKALFYFYLHDKSVDAGNKPESACPYLKFARQLRKQAPGSQRYAKIVANAIEHLIYRSRNNYTLRDEVTA